MIFLEEYLKIKHSSKDGEMDVIHITKTSNLKSIMKYGIFRNKPFLDVYNKVMKEEYGEKYNKEKGLVFGFPESINKRNKYIKDFVYWKTWGDPRNLKIAKDDLNFKYVSLITYNYTILLLDIKYDKFFDMYVHQQTHDMNDDIDAWKNMDSRYEHNDKPLCLMNYDIPISKIRTLGNVEPYIIKNKIDMRLKIET